VTDGGIVYISLTGGNIGNTPASSPGSWDVYLPLGATGPTGATGASASYTPADSADWTGADPTTVAEALDRIAAALGPIA